MDFVDQQLQSYQDLVAQFLAKMDKPIDVLSNIPGFLLAIAPAWYMFAGASAPRCYAQSSSVQKLTVVVPLLVGELAQQPMRSSLYSTHKSLNLALILISLFALSLTMLTRRSFIVNASFDTLLVIDGLKICLLLSGTISYAQIIFPITLSTTRICFFLVPNLWCSASGLLKNNLHLTRSITSLWQSPFRITSAENVKDLGEEFASGSLHHRYNQIRAQLNKREGSHFTILYTILLTLKWDLLLLLLVRLALAITNIAQPQALRQTILVAQQDHAVVTRRCRAFAFVSMVFVFRMIIRQVFSRLVNRFSTFVRGILVGQIQTKILRLSVLDAQDQGPKTLMNSDIDQITNSIPDILQLAGIAFELGAALSDSRRAMGFATHSILASTMCGLIVPYKLFSRIAMEQDSWTQAIKTRVLNNTQILLQARLVKMAGIDDLAQKYLAVLHDREMWKHKYFRRIQTWHMLGHSMFDKPMVYFSLSVAISWTKLSSDLRPDFLFPSLLLVNTIIEQLVAINRTYNQYQRFIAYYHQLQTFLSVKEVQSNLSDERLIRIKINHCLVNDLSVIPGQAHINTHQRAPRNQDQIQLFNTSVTLQGSNVPIFKHFSVSIPRGRLTVVMGATASGKSQFLKVLLNEVMRNAGQLYVEPGTAIAYCGQDVWLLHKSIRQNIVGDHPFSESRYADAIRRCQLSEDLAVLPDGDSTFLGGITTLSNSQQYKVALARICYSNAPLVFIDDILSLLDGITASQIFASLLSPGGLFREQRRTVVLATRLRSHMANANLAIFLDGNGHVITRDAGEMFSLPPLLRSIVQQLTGADIVPGPDVADQETQVQGSHSILSKSVAEAIDGAHENNHSPTVATIFMNLVPKRFFIGFIPTTVIAAATGRIPDLVALLMINSNIESKPYLIWFAVLSLLYALTTFWSLTYYFEFFAPSFLIQIYEAVVAAVMNAQFSYLTTAEHSSTTDQLNQHMTTTSRTVIVAFLRLIYFSFIILVDVVIVAALPRFAVPTVTCLVSLVYLIYKYYIPLCDQVQLLEKEAKETLLVHYTDTAAGVEQIRASQQQLVVASRALDLLDKSQICFYRHLDARRWVNFIIDLFTTSTIVIAAGIGCMQLTDAATLGLVLFIIQSFDYSASFAIETLLSFRASLPSLVYLLEFIKKTPTETLITSPDKASAWPEIGTIGLRNVTSRHKQEATNQAGIIDMSLVIKLGQKVVLEGAARSGKSSLILTILNFLDYEGSIFVGGVDISTIPQHQLRSRISTLPATFLQLPGTVEQNLMPWRLVEGENSHVDAGTLQKVLGDLSLRDCLENFGGLDTLMKKVELSEGQRAQFAIARLILHHIQYRNTIVLMDDPLAKLDATMRTKMADLLHKYFGKSTVLIACKDASDFYDLDAVHLLHNGRIYESAEMAPDTADLEQEAPESQ